MPAKNVNLAYCRKLASEKQVEFSIPILQHLKLDKNNLVADMLRETGGGVCYAVSTTWLSKEIYQMKEYNKIWELYTQELSDDKEDSWGPTMNLFLLENGSYIARSDNCEQEQKAYSEEMEKLKNSLKTKEKESGFLDSFSNLFNLKGSADIDNIWNKLNELKINII